MAKLSRSRHISQYLSPDTRPDVNPSPLPHLQFAVLGVLGAGDLPGREIRSELGQLGVDKSGPAFYRLMARLEESGLVEGRYEQEVVSGQMLRERRYRATAEGCGLKIRW